MIDACDPDADIETLRKLIKLNTGDNLTLTRKDICQVYDEIQDGKLPLPPLIMSSNRTYLTDRKSPLKPRDYEVLFSSTSKRSDLRRIAQKIGLKRMEQMTKIQIIDAIGKRLRYMNIHEPIKIGRKKVRVEVRDAAVNNAAVNNTAVNNAAMNNTAMNNTAVNNTAVNNIAVNNTAVNRTAVNRTAVNRTAVNRTPNFLKTKQNSNGSKINFPKNGILVRGVKPKFLGGNTRATSKRNFISSNSFTGAKPGYVFKKNNKGTGYYKNTYVPIPMQGPVRITEYVMKSSDRRSE
jgi:hypothetical protein